jgi:Nuclease subunit of the excinuclease complex
MNDIQSIKNKVKSIPELPGIYKMLDSNNNIIYIGKSKCLRKRVQSYFVNSPKWEKVNKMVTMIKDIDYIVTDTHLEARLLECELIKRYQPRFNAQMKNDKRYIYIRVNPYNPYHVLSVVEERDADCFGPFRRKYAMNEFFGMLTNIYPINKSEHGYDFDYNLFPHKMNKEEFEQNRQELLELLSDHNKLLLFIDFIQTKLEEAASQYRYEVASYYRDIKYGFMSIKNGLDGYKNLSSRNILLKLPLLEGYKLFFISNSLIKCSRIVDNLSDLTIKDFIEYSKFFNSSIIPVPISEKSFIDYRDILFSEMNDLPDDMVELISE